MKCVIPSTSVRSKFLKTLPMGTIYKDPRNNHVYKVDEKKINSTLSKVGVPYFGSEIAVEIEVPEKHLKLENPVRFNVNQSLKERINELEQTINDLRSKSDFTSDGASAKPTTELNPIFKEIRQLMGNNQFYERDRELFEVDINSQIVFYTKKREGIDAKVSIENQKQQFWSDRNVCDDITRYQPAIQKRLWKHLKNEVADEKVVSFKKGRKSPLLK